jgi:hypothetical protein
VNFESPIHEVAYPILRNGGPPIRYKE